MSPSPYCLVNSSSTLNGVNVAAGATITIALSSTSGVTQWSLQCTSTNNLSTQPISGINATLVVNQIAKTATVTVPNNFCALQFTSIVNNGVDVNNTPQPSYTTTFGVWVLTGTGLRTIFPGETTESDPVNGWVTDINNQIENDTSGPGSAGLGLFYNTGSYNVGLDTNGNITTPGAYIQLSNTLTWASGAVSLRASNSSLSLSASNGVSINSAFTVQSGALTYMSGIASPTINQTTTAVNNATGNPLTIQAQNATGTTSNGGNLLLYSGTGTSNAGNVAISVGSNLAATYSPSGLAWSTNAVSFVPGASNPTISQQTQTSNVATNILNITAQAPFASATGTNQNAGSIYLNLAGPVSGGARGQIVIWDAGNSLHVLSGDASGNGIINISGAGILTASSSLAITASQVGFHSATPVSQATGIGAITDSTGGTASSTFASITAGTLYAQADMVACKNALAETAAQLNKINTILKNIGITT